MPAALRDVCHVTGVELDPVTARIVKLLQPHARILNEDFARVELRPHFDLAIGNPPFSDRTVRSDRAFRALGLRLHDYFIAKSIDRLKPGGLAAFVTSTGTMDKADASAREHIAAMADLVGAIRLPEGSFRAEAGTDVVVDILFFRKRLDGEPAGERCLARSRRGSRCDRRRGRDPHQPVFRRASGDGARHARSRLGPVRRSLHLPAACGHRSGRGARRRDPAPSGMRLRRRAGGGRPRSRRAGGRRIGATNAGRRIREGSYFIGANGALMQMVDGEAVTIKIRKRPIRRRHLRKARAASSAS